MESSPRVINTTQTPSPKSFSSNNSSTITNISNGNDNSPSISTITDIRPIMRSEPASSNNPYPTTFVQADTTSFKKVVQMLTGSPETVTRRQDPTRNSNPIPVVKPGSIRKDQPYRSASSKLYERRNSFKNIKTMMISPLGGHARGSGPGGGGVSPGCTTRPGMPEVLSPSLLDFPSLVLSPVTPLIPDPFKRVGSGLDAEERAIKEKGFYLHPSPRAHSESTAAPRLLPLFPVTSPRVVAAREGSSCSSASDEDDENRAAAD